MTKYQLKFSPNARQDLNDIYEYALDSLGEYWADIILKRILQDIYKLNIFPTGYSKILEIPNLRKKKSKKYIIIFKINEKDKIPQKFHTEH